MLILTACVALTGCSNDDESADQRLADSLAPDTSAAAVTSPVLYAYAYRCADGATFEVHIDPTTNTAVLTLDTVQYTLTQDTTASGTRYSNDTLAFWSKGDTAFIVMHDVIRHRNCVVIPRSALSDSL